MRAPVGASVGAVIFAALAALAACGANDDATSTSSLSGAQGSGVGGNSGGVGGAGSGGDGLGGGGGGGGGGDGGAGGDGGSGWTGVPTDVPLRLLFLGNSFTHQGPVPELVRDVAASVGWPAPEVAFNAPGGQSLAFHRTSEESLLLVDAGDWDFVVLQDFSTRPTDNVGDPQGFKADASWFYDRIKAASPAAQVVLYETWARHPDHSFYPNTFATPLEMQAQLRFHYNDAADVFIPNNAGFVPATHVRVAPVGDAWEAHLGGPDPLRLHASDDYHAGDNGQYLNAVVLYSTIYGVVASGASGLGLPDRDAAALQAAADATTGITQAPPSFPQPPLAVGQTIRIDFGSVASGESGWNTVTDCVDGASFDLVDALAIETGIDVLVADAFTGGNEAGLANNGLGYPAAVSSDVCWLGSFDGHEAALLETAVVALEDVDAGSYDLTLFASRSGTDNGNGRLTRFTVGTSSLDLEVSDNTTDTAMFTGITPDAAGRIVVEVAVSPAGAARFGYLGALVLTKTAD